MPRISKRSVDQLSGQSTGTVIRDDEIAGFQARRNSDSISYSFEYRAGRGRGAPVRRFAIGRHGALTPEQARDRARELAAQVALGGDPAAVRSKERATPTLETFAKSFFEEAASMAERHPESAKFRPKSLETYSSLWRRHIRPAIGKLRLDQVSSERIERLHAEIGRKTPVAANRVLDVIGTLFREAGKAGQIDKGINPARGIEPFKETAKERFLSEAEFVRLGEAIRVAETTGVPWERPEPRPGKKNKHVPKALPNYVIDPYSAAALRVLIFSGARLREVLNAKWDDVSFEHGTLTVNGKTGRKHLMLPAPALEAIRHLDKFGDYVFASGDPAKPKADLKRPWVAVCRLADLQGTRLHDLRHSFASTAASSGQPLLIVSKLLGHSDIAMTQRYSHIGNDPLRQAAERTAAQIDAAMSGKAAKVISIKGQH